MFQGIGERIRNGKQEKKKDTKERNSDAEQSWEDNLTEI